MLRHRSRIKKEAGVLPPAMTNPRKSAYLRPRPNAAGDTGPGKNLLLCVGLNHSLNSLGPLA